MASEALPRVTFGIIVLNGEPFTRYCLRSVYPFAHQIIVVEGAAPGARGIATPDGHSRDGTLDILRDFKRHEDPEGKLTILTAEDWGHADGFWPGEKHEQSRAYATRATGDYLWQVDIDEFYRHADMQALLARLRDDPGITAVSFKQLGFWGGFDYLAEAWHLRRGEAVFHRLFRWGRGYRYTTHRPPTVVDRQGRDLRSLHWLSARQLARQGIYLYHYSLLFPKQVLEKCEYYDGAQWAPGHGYRAWAECNYLRLQDPFRVHNVHQNNPSWLTRFSGPHPEQIETMRADIAAGRLNVELRPTDDVQRLLNTWWYRPACQGLKLLDYVDRAVAPLRRPLNRFTQLPRRVLRRVGRQLGQFRVPRPELRDPSGYKPVLQRARPRSRKSEFGAGNFPVIIVENLSKRYKIGRPLPPTGAGHGGPTTALRRHFRRLAALSQRGQEDEFIWALRDASFEVHPGEVVGIIGRNGSGKSTLLKILSRVVHPTTGRAVVRGRVGSLLEVGTGFHPELTGRENIFLNGSILGMSRAEIRAHFDEIVAFAEIERFLDTPVKRYSSGMYVRLAFAVAAHLLPEILFIDEVLAVGDVGFQQKCLGRMSDASRAGRTILFVSHNLAAITQICTRAIVLDSGQITFDGPPAEATRRLIGRDVETGSLTRFSPPPNARVAFTSLGIVDEDGQPAQRCERDDRLSLVVEYVVCDWPVGTYLCVCVTNQGGVNVLWSADVDDAADLAVARSPGTYRARIALPQGLLPAGRYTVSLAAYAPECGELFAFHEHAAAFEVVDHDSLLARLSKPHPAVVAAAMPWRTERAPVTRDTSEASLAEVGR